MGEEKKGKPEKVLKKLMTGNSPNLAKYKTLQIQKGK